MAEMAVSVVSTMLVEPILLPYRFKYLLNYSSNMKNLKVEIQKLGDRFEMVQFAVESAKRQMEEVEMFVHHWLIEAEGIFYEYEYLVKSAREFEDQCCCDLKKRYRLSRKAKQMTNDILELAAEGTFGHVSLAPRRRLTRRDYTFDAVLDSVRDPDVQIIGVYGMGGLGKTTLAKKVAMEAMEEKLFDVVIMICVSQEPDLRRIQHEIAEQLGLHFHEESSVVRARRLYGRLKKDGKVLLILDDLWTALNLDEVGIPLPYDQSGFKLLLTSRNQNVLQMMEAQKCFLLETLGHDEAFNLFRSIVGDQVELPEFQSLAKEVVDACGGVPVAIVTIARTLKHRSLHVWKDILRKMRASASSYVEEMQIDVFSSVQLSYDYLSNEELKLTFLLCGIMEDASLEDLLRYLMGLGMLREVLTVEDARNRVATLVQSLKDSSLLLDTSNSRPLFDMHDLIRDVARSIASRDRHMFTLTDDSAKWVLADNARLKNCAAISLHDIRVLPDKFECPQLKIFYLQTNDPFLTVSDDFFRGLPELKVLHLMGVGLLSLPTSLSCLVKLRTLCMSRCKLTDVAIIGVLTELEFLGFHGSDIKKLPERIKELTKLRLLDLSRCSKLETISPNVISCLTNLEEIYMRETPIQWEDEGLRGTRSNAALGELKHLSHLTTLEIRVQDAKLIPNELFSEMLKRYKIVIGDDWGQPVWDKEYDTARTLKLSASHVERVWPDQFPVTSSFVGHLTFLVVHGCEKLRSLFTYSIFNSFKQLQYLEICDCPVLEEIVVAEEPIEEERRDLIMPELRYLKIDNLENLSSFFSGGPIKFPHLKEMELHNCPELKAIIFTDKVEFPEVEKLIISGMDNLNMIWGNQVVEGSFCKLRSFQVKDCQNLLTVFPSCICERLFNLESLAVISCGSVEQIFDYLELTVYQTKDSQLREIYIDNLPNLKHIWNEEFRAMPSLSKLQKVSVFLCPILNYLFPASSATSLLKLESVEVSNCGLEEVIRRGRGLDEFVFPQLISLQLHCLPELRALCLEFDKMSNVRKLGLHHCDKIEVTHYLAEKLCPNLEELQLSGNAIGMEWLFKAPEGYIGIFKSYFGILKCLELNDDESAALPLDIIHKFRRLEKLTLNNGSYQVLFPYTWIQENLWILSQMKHLVLSELYVLEQIWEQHSDVDLDFESFEILEVRSCASLVNLMPSPASFRNLTSLEVGGCEKLENLFTSWTAKSLVLLEKLELFDCKMLTEVIANDGAAAEEIHFSNLKSLSLVYLQNLSSFGSVNHILKLPVLENLAVNECPKMKLFSGSTITSNLSELELNWKVFEQSGKIDLNMIIQRDFENRLPGREETSDPCA